MQLMFYFTRLKCKHCSFTSPQDTLCFRFSLRERLKPRLIKNRVTQSQVDSK